MFPKGNNADYLSVYLDVADSGELPYQWSRYASFKLVVRSQFDAKWHTIKGGLEGPSAIAALGVLEVCVAFVDIQSVNS